MTKVISRDFTKKVSSQGRNLTKTCLVKQRERSPPSHTHRRWEQEAQDGVPDPDVFMPFDVGTSPSNT
jgi:hypothetical protein